MGTETTFRDLLEEIAKQQEYDEHSIQVTPISTGGANYTSLLYTGIISAPNKEDLHLFGKVANLSEKLREEFPISAFEVERMAYLDLVKIYETIEDKHNIPEEDRLVVPKFYGFNPNVGQETVVLENLSVKGFTLHDRTKSVDWPYAAKAVEVLARFHALSMAYSEEKPESFQSHCEKLYSLAISFYDSMKKGVEMFLPLSLAAVKEENKDRLQAFFDNKENLDFNQMMKPIQKPVLVHGDYRPSNLMNRNNEDGSVEVIPVDLQTIQPSSPVLDLVYFIFTGTDAAFREQYYTQLVDLYYSTLSRMLRAYGLDPEKIYPRDDFDCELKEKLYSGLVLAVMLVPLVTVDNEEAPSMGGTFSMEDLIINPSKLFPERLNGIVDDFVRWGLL